MGDASHHHLCNSTKREIPDIRSLRRLDTDGKKIRSKLTKKLRSKLIRRQRFKP